METKVLAVGFAERMPESGGLESGVVLVQGDQQIEVVQGGVIQSDQINFTDTKVGVGPRCLSDQQFVVVVVAVVVAVVLQLVDSHTAESIV